MVESTILPYLLGSGTYPNVSLNFYGRCYNISY